MSKQISVLANEAAENTSCRVAVFHHGMTAGNYDGVEHFICRVDIFRARVADPNIADVTPVFGGVGNVFYETNATPFQKNIF